jgi:hypothetical protein
LCCVSTCYIRFGFYLKRYLDCQFSDSFPSKSSLVPVLFLGAKDYSEKAMKFEKNLATQQLNENYYKVCPQLRTMLVSHKNYSMGSEIFSM